MAKVLVLNATGKVSASVVDALVAKGHDVTAASRSAAKDSRANVRAVRFDYTDPSTFEPALEGVDRLFWVSPPLVLDGHGLSKPFFDLALKRVKKAVLMTASGVDVSDQIPLRQAELLVERSGVPFVHLRPTWFMDNFHSFWVDPIRHQGVIPLPAADAKTAFVDARDIADSAAAALVRDDIANKAFVITGPTAFTYAEAATVLAKAAGRPVSYVPIEDEAFVQGAVKGGIQEPYARLLVQLFQAVRAGAASAVTSAVEQLTGKSPRTLDAYAREYADAWKVG